MLPVVVRQVRQVHGEVQSWRKLLEIAGQTRVDRVASQVDDASVRQYRVNYTEIVGVDGCLIYDARCVGGVAVQNPQIFFRQLLPQRLSGWSLPYRCCMLTHGVVPEWQFSGCLHGSMRSEDLRDERCPGTQHANDEDRLHGGGTATLCPGDRLSRVEADQVVDEPRVRVWLILFRNNRLQQLVAALVTAKGRLEVRDIVVVLSHCKAQAGLYQQ